MKHITLALFIGLVGLLFGAAGVAQAAGAAGPPSPRGRLHMAVVLINFYNNPVQHTTPAQAADMINQVSTFYKEQSYGAVDIYGEVLGPYTATDNTQGCSFITSMVQSAVDAVAAHGGGDLRSYDLIQIVNPCPTYFSMPGSGFSFIWDGRYTSHVANHEIGHLFFLNHANTITCPGGTLDANAKCQWNEYKNLFDIMGDGAGAVDDHHFNALERSLIGWITPQKVTTSGIYTINPLEFSNSSVKALEIDSYSPAQGSYSLVLEYHQPAGTWPYYTPEVLNGVMINAMTNSFIGTELLDMSPNDGNRINSPLAIGQTYSDAGWAALSIPPFTITALSNDANGIRVQITFGGQEPLAVSLTPSAATLQPSQTQQFTAAVSGTANTNVSWSIWPNVGSISSTGSYMAPSIISASQSIVVTATSLADNTTAVHALVTLLPAGTPVITQQPQNTSVSQGQTASFSVTATGSGLSYQWQMAPSETFSFSNIPGATTPSYSTPALQSADNARQYRCMVTNAGGSATSSAAAVSVSAPATGLNFVTSVVAGTARNNYSGWVGMTVAVGSSPITVTSLGRYTVAGNSQTHVVKLIQASNGADVANGSIVVNSLGAASANFAYAQLPLPVTLNANTTYYLMSLENAGGDQWYDNNTIVQTTGDAFVSSAVYGTGTPYTTTAVYGAGAGHSYVPLDFKYTAGGSAPVPPPTPTGSAFITAKSPGTPRNNFSGWVGMAITTGSSPVPVTALGRMVIAGNNQAHTVRIVLAANGTDVASAAVNTQGAAAGSFAYASLPATVTLNANTNYYILSQETVGVDQWYDYDTTVQTGTAASITGAAWTNGSSYNVVANCANHSYAPVDFMFASSGTASRTAITMPLLLRTLPRRR